ncbi:kinase domain protein [Penicillium samsonianum]|uniref:kinase domain protein n=1 Tax=Penicillium samsonianum TaxID=1882272 RepID=UPI0025490940|nr:kinase domain protein [Penicillium samsonianum]KAJ6149021.1 kinase domain protein [Penicillium samsonianum]
MSFLTPQSWPWQSTKYITLKPTNLGDEEKKATEEEITVSQHIAALHSAHDSLRYVQLVKESFQVQGHLG